MGTAVITRPSDRQAPIKDALELFAPAPRAISSVDALGQIWSVDKALPDNERQVWVKLTNGSFGSSQFCDGKWRGIWALYCGSVTEWREIDWRQ